MLINCYSIEIYKKVMIPDGDAELYAAKQKQWCGHRAVSCVMKLAQRVVPVWLEKEGGRVPKTLDTEGTGDYNTSDKRE